MKSPQAFRTISEVSSETKIPTHVLRFWESKFPKINPLHNLVNLPVLLKQDLVPNLKKKSRKLKLKLYKK